MAALVDSSFEEDNYDGPAVGIDLGTTFSCVAVFHNGRARVIPNEHGNRVTPSVISFTDDGIISGDEARSRLTLSPTNTVYESKRLIGRTFTEDTVQNDIHFWPFSVLNDNDKPQVQVMLQKKMKTFLPEEISAIVLGKMKRTASSYLRKEIRKAVITVPAYFNETQRQATIDSAKVAGLEVLRIINEPTAAAMAYGLKEKASDSERRVLVFDLGGGTFDVSVLVIDEGAIRVKATGGDTHLGGSDFDNRVVDKVINWFNSKYDVTENVTTNVKKREFHRLRKACEIAKCELSHHDTAQIQVENFWENNDLIYNITREEFEELNSDLFKKTIDIVNETLEDADLRPEAIDDVILIGGSTRVPKIRQCLMELFGGKTLNTTVNPDEAVACGAAIQAAILDGNESAELEDVVLMDITPLSLGINIQGDKTLTIIKRNSLIPCKYTKTLTTTEDDQIRIDMDVYQGERTLSKDNHYLGEFYIDNLMPDKRGVARIDVTFSIDSNGLLQATAKDRFMPTTEHSVCIDPNRAINSDEDVKRLVQEAEKYQQEDQRETNRINSRNKLEQFAYWVQRTLLDKHSDLNMSSDDKRNILDKVREILTWMTYNVYNDAEDYRARLVALQSECRDIPAEYLRPGHSPDSDDGNTSAKGDDDAESDVPEVD